MPKHVGFLLTLSKNPCLYFTHFPLKNKDGKNIIWSFNPIPGSFFLYIVSPTYHFLLWRFLSFFYTKLTPSYQIGFSSHLIDSVSILRLMNKQIKWKWEYSRNDQIMSYYTMFPKISQFPKERSLKFGEIFCWQSNLPKTHPIVRSIKWSHMNKSWETTKR